jgi:hypothetical protein
VTLQDFFDKYGDEFTGLLMRGYGESFASILLEGKDSDQHHAVMGRAYKRREARALDMLRRIFDDLTGGADEQSKQHAGNGRAADKARPGNGPDVAGRK